MISSTFLHKILTYIIGTSLIPLVISIVTFFYTDTGGGFARMIVVPSVLMPIIILVTLTLAPIIIIFYILNLLLFKERAEHQNTRQRLDAALVQRKESELLRFIDVVTRIPNQLQWEDDIQSIQTELDSGHKFQSILIDLDALSPSMTNSALREVMPLSCISRRLFMKPCVRMNEYTRRRLVVLIPPSFGQEFTENIPVATSSYS